MRYRRVISCLAVSLVALMLVSTDAPAQTKPGTFEIGAAATFVRFDTQAGIDSRFVPSFILGYYFTQRHGAELIFTTGSATPDKDPVIGIDFDIIRAGYTYNAYPKDKWSSFFRAGLGVLKLDPEPHPMSPERLEDSDDQYMVYSGGGARYHLGQRYAIRIAATVDFIDAGQGILNADLQATGELGFVFLLGGREPGSKPDEVEATPAEPPTTEDQK
ncbi:MAG TPA: outer membrane beta-barrel protein [Candidatus Polarisedimenticolia bacterium]|nr:outer membrane beta-barrel protein [Candidatus Polarisedimenticolia bacterium]